MSSASLTARYRPQTFAEVAGQDTLKAILSRASLEDRVAPAYLFSGTRGVGKTTLARVFAKALNCRTAPTAEPCNTCDQCKAVMQGNAVDVVEIDGASNRGIDDVRRLKEVVGYAPMEGRYKIFIIDEAHMLSREAFNALLKTLEEPPARVTFIMATTEPHKFPATIISRCQHYVFKRLPEAELAAHLESVLQREQRPFETGAVRLIARRGAGSVRDAMSLLGQVLALGGDTLTEEATRNVLGLAGQEAFLRMLAAFRNGETVELTRLLREMLDQGLDMGFFLRELASLWRNMFILCQTDGTPEALAVVDLPEVEGRALLDVARGFSLSHIHAAWQMTLEGQRRVLTSLEPALALELLVLNLAMLPRLISLEQLTALGRRAGPKPEGAAGATGSGTAGSDTTGSGSTRPSPAGSGRANSGVVGSGSTVAGTAGSTQSATPAQATEPLLPGSPDTAGMPTASGIPSAEEETAPSAPGAEPDAGRAAASTKPAQPADKQPLRENPPMPDETRAAGDETPAPDATSGRKTSVLPDPSRKDGPKGSMKTREELRREVLEHPAVKVVEQTFDARILDYGQIRQS